jgi:hypothetical protein
MSLGSAQGIQGPLPMLSVSCDLSTGTSVHRRRSLDATDVEAVHGRRCGGSDAGAGAEEQANERPSREAAAASSYW